MMCQRCQPCSVIGAHAGHVAAILDGEIICLDGRGVSQFHQLLNRKAEPVFYGFDLLFDLLWLNGEDWMHRPLIERQARLRRSSVRQDVNGCCTRSISNNMAKGFFKEICELDLEGIVAKQKMSTYKPGGNGWLKIKNRSYSQAEGRHELLTKRSRKSESVVE